MERIKNPTPIMQHLIREYKILTIQFGTIEVDDILNFKMYCKERKTASALEMYEHIENIINIYN
jgi:hypothetical protein